MGTLTLSGVLKRPISGDVVPNARITFDAIATGNVVLKGVSSSCKTASDGSYSVDLEYGDYTIQVSWAGQTQQYGTVHIDDTTPTGSLNDLLMQELTESQLTPEIVLEFRQLEQEMQDDLAQMEDLNTEAAGSASTAASSAAAAATSETNSAASEDAAAASASAADASAKSIEGDADAAAASAKAAATSETNAAVSEDAAASSATAANTSETNAAGSEAASAASAAAAQVSESDSAASEVASGESAAAAKTSETNAQASQEAAATSETNAKNARDAAEEYAQEAKDAASKVTSPLTDQGQWAIQAGYPSTPDIASVWQITDGGVDPVNSDIIWDPGDMLVYLATTGTWCRLLGQQVVAGEPVPLKIDADIILNVGSGLQIVTSGTTAVDVVRLDADNNLVLGADALPGICLKTAEPTSLFVLVPDGNGGYIKSRIYSEVFPPPETEPPVTSVNSKTGDVELTAADVSALPSGGGVLTGDLSGTDASFTGFVSAPDVQTSRINTGGAVLEFGTGAGTTSDYYWDIHTTYPEADYDYRFHFRSDVNTIELLNSITWANLVVGNLEAIGLTAIHSNYTVFVNGTAAGLDGSGFTAYYNSSGVDICNAGYYMGGWDIHFYDDTGLWVSNPVHVDRNGTVTINSQLNVSTVYESGQRVYSPNNPPPIDLSGYETIADASARFIQGVQFGAETAATYSTTSNTVPGTAISFVAFNTTYSGSIVSRYKSIQQNFNGIWATIGG
ncbi:prophage tail fiber N-terminal domain-containing protein [Citrobacter freundii]|uniref:prophage tail fiber N-terminal domain-containing protein n=1 Tax=Citrobacter freundii TaxID=546 RepID=UPI00397B450E